MYSWITIATPAELSKLESALPPEYEPKRVAATLANGISSAVKAVLIENDYIDKDYRSTYYHFYAKKGQRFRLECVRLHFFDSSVSFEPTSLRISTNDGRLADHYFGYMVLRPTGIATIGRTVLSPDIRSGANQLIITGDHKAHVLGHKLTISGFPSMDQHVDIAVCAHVACWSILRHYSERYAVYREFLTHDITMMAHDFDPGGLLPSQGLQVSHAERVFQRANTFPINVARGTAPDPAFYRQLCAYVESGFPLFAAMHSLRHAVAVVGYDWRTPGAGPAAAGMRYAWDELQSLAVVDDNYLPYLSIPVSPIAGAPYSAEDVDTFIVPLPEKIYYPADAVDRLAPALYVFDGPLRFPKRDESIVRYFVTTASALRTFVREKESEFGPELLQAVMTSRFAQFVWIVEFATPAQWAVGQVEVRAVVDATASLRESLPLWLLHDRSVALTFDRKLVANPTAGFSAFPLTGISHGGFTRMDRNLRPTQAK